MSTWHVDVTVTSEKQVTDDSTFEIMENLTGLSSNVAVHPDRHGALVSVFVDAPNIFMAITEACNSITPTVLPWWGAVEVVGIEAKTETAFEAELAEPLYPDVVGLAEIAVMAGVSRQRAAQFRSLPGFPDPVIVTGQGPLMSKAAVEVWLSNRVIKTGRPKKTAEL